MIAPPLPWHAEQWARVERTVAGERLAHAILLRGVRGTGKTLFARRLMARILCTGASHEARPCSACRPCRLLEAGSHPDHVELTPPEDRRSIGVEQVRDLIDTLALTSRYESYKVALVHPAEAMTHAAANALLKTLEEPPGDTVIVLVAHRPTLLPATVRSRCQMIDFHVPGPAPALEWLVSRELEQTAAEDALRLAGGAPLLALELAAANASTVHEAVAGDLAALVARRVQPVPVAERWSAHGLGEALGAIAAIGADLARIKAGMPDAALTHARGTGTLHAIAGGLDSTVIHRLLDEVLELQRAQARQLNLNPQLALEGLASRWWQAAGR